MGLRLGTFSLLLSALPSCAVEAAEHTGRVPEDPQREAASEAGAATPSPVDVVPPPPTDAGPDREPIPIPEMVDAASVIALDAGSRDAGTIHGEDAAPPAMDQFQALDALDEDPDTPTESAFLWSRGIGNWFVTTSDGETRDAPSVPLDPPRGDSTRGRRAVSGDPPMATDLWLELDHPWGRPVDLSGYTGLAFWARLEGSSDVLTVLFGARGLYQDPTVVSESFPTVSFTVSTEWEQFVIAFDDLDSDGLAFSSLDFVVGTDGGDFELFIDELQLLCRESCEP